MQLHQKSHNVFLTLKKLESEKIDAAATQNPPAMAEISEPLLDSTSENLKISPEFDQETTRKTKPGLKRFALTLTVLFSFLLGLPFLLKSVEIYRSPLPFREIDDLSAEIESSTLLFPCQFRAVFVNFGGDVFTANELSISIQSDMRKFTARGYPSCGACSYNSSVSVALDSGSDCVHSGNDLNWKCGELRNSEMFGKYDDELIDEYLHSLLGDNGGSGNGGKVYSVIVVRNEEEEVVRAVVGKYRHAWIVGKVSEEEVVEKVAEIFVRVFVNGGKDEGSISGEFMPVGADGRIVLSFNLLNADPRDWNYDWYGALLMLFHDS